MLRYRSMCHAASSKRKTTERAKMKSMLIVVFCSSLVANISAEQVLAKYDWRQLARTGQLPGGVAAEMDGKSVLKAVNTNATPLKVQLLKIPKPPISKKLYAIKGEIKYE